MQTLMHRMARLVAGTLVLAIAGAFCLTCIAGSKMTRTREACYAAMHHKCSPVAQQDCCSVEATQVDQFAPATKVARDASAVLAIAGTMIPSVVELSLRVRLSSFADLLHRPGSAPTSLLASALRI